MSTNVFVPTNQATYDESKLCVTINDKVAININDSIECGMVRFVGSIKNKQDIFYGIELEKAIGKNDGIINKQEYFRCGQKRGIFVKRSRIKYVEHPNPNVPRVTVGDIVRIGGSIKCKGTIKYIGTPSFKRLEGKIWYGVELNKEIGKNDGSVGNIRYFLAKERCGYFATSKMIHVCKETHFANDKSNGSVHMNDEEKKEEHGIVIQNVESRKHSRKRSMEKVKMKRMVRSRTMPTESSSNSIDESKETDKGIYEKRFIIHKYGFAVSFLLTDKNANISILKQQIIHTFGHIEVLSDEQIEIKNVDKMCMVIKIIFLRSKSAEKALKWKFWWNKKNVSLKRLPFKKWKEKIDVKKIFPICFCYKTILGLLQDNIKKYLIEYLNNLEELLQNKSQIQFVHVNDDEIKVNINFANGQARDKLFASKFIDLSTIKKELKQTENAKDYHCKFVIEQDFVII